MHDDHDVEHDDDDDDNDADDDDDDDDDEGSMASLGLLDGKEESKQK